MMHMNDGSDYDVRSNVSSPIRGERRRDGGGRRENFQDRYNYSKEKASYVSQDWNTDASLGKSKASTQYSYPQSQFQKPRYQNQYCEEFYQAYGDPLRSQMNRRNPSPYHTPGLYMHDNNASHHHPLCSCLQCHKKSYTGKPYDVSSEKMFDYEDIHDHNGRVSTSPLMRPDIRQLDVNSKDGFARRRTHLKHSTSSGRHCSPIAGGAPFLSCYNCFELLMLPKKIMTQSIERKKITCGECSTVIAFAVSNKTLVVLTDNMEAMGAHVRSQNNLVRMPKHGDGHLNQVRTTFASDDSGYDYVGREREQYRSSSTNNFVLREDDDNLMAARKDSGKDKGRLPGDQMMPDKDSAKQILTNDTSATEIDLSSNEYNITGSTFDSGEGSKGDQRRRNRAVSFLSVYKDKIFKDTNGSDQTEEPEKANVTVNGHLIPDRLIRKAEKLAGSIEPGNYWYDIRAGFWGVMGGPCIGIIPPFIAEFNHPMAESCSGGSTRIYVNGRELNHSDLNLLGRRGLPPETDKSYIVEISGRILDADTGNELQSLGKLAPSVEKAKRGFGMRDPDAPSQ